jgi:hypothetical protein
MRQKFKNCMERIIGYTTKRGREELNGKSIQRWCEKT